MYVLVHLHVYYRMFIKYCVFSRNSRKFATSPSPALGYHWLYKKLPANRSDWNIQSWLMVRVDIKQALNIRVILLFTGKTENNVIFCAQNEPFSTKKVQFSPIYVIICIVCTYFYSHKWGNDMYRVFIKHCVFFL